MLFKNLKKTVQRFKSSKTSEKTIYLYLIRNNHLSIKLILQKNVFLNWNFL